jgi:rod shape-determining protein MreC
MQLRKGSFLGLALPVKVAAQRVMVFLLIAGAAGLLVLGKADLAAIERLKTISTDALGPVLQFASQPVAAVNRGIDRISSLANLAEENARLRTENARLRRWEAVSRKLEQENAAFRRLLNAKSDPLVLPITARVIGDSGGPFVRTLLLNAGEREGVRKNQAVISETGLIGRVVATGERSSRILLITDLNSRIPVFIENSRVRGIVAGDNTGQPKLEFLPANAQISPGDRIVTSGDGGMLPPGQPIGVVSSVTDRVIRVQPFADWGRLEYVSVLRYDLPRLSDPSENPGDLGESGLGR